MRMREPEKIKEVSRRKNWFHILTDSGTGFAFEAKYLNGEKPPHVGDEIECHAEWGSRIRGVTLRGKLLFMKTDEEIEAEHAEWKAKHELDQKRKFGQQRKRLNEDYDSLPVEFQRRISWFRAHNGDFRWKNEAYEMSSCVDAVKIAETLKTEAKIRRFSRASNSKQHEMVPDLAYEYHSGNSFGMAVRLAHLYVQNPLWVILEHGAMVPLTGCEEYGCAHPRPADVMASMPEETAAA